MSTRTVTNVILDCLTTAPVINVVNEGILKTDRLYNMSLYCIYDRVDADGAGDIYVYGSIDGTTATRYLIGFAPTLTGTRDTDGKLSFTSNLTIVLEVPGVHPYVHVTWTETTDATTFIARLIGTEYL